MLLCRLILICCTAKMLALITLYVYLFVDVCLTDCPQQSLGTRWHVWELLLLPRLLFLSMTVTVICTCGEDTTGPCTRRAQRRCNNSHCPFSSLTHLTHWRLAFSPLIHHPPPHPRLAFSWHQVQSLSFPRFFSYLLLSPLIHPTGNLPSLVTRCNHSHCYFSSLISSSLLLLITYQSGSCDKYCTGDVLKFELDMDHGSLTMYKNGTKQAHVFDGLEGTVYPAVAFYGSARVVRLVEVTG